MFLSQMTVNLEPNGDVRAVRGEYLETDANGRTTPVGTKRLAGADIETALPTVGALLAQIEGLQAEIVELKKERDDAVTAKATAELQSQIDALNVQLNPVDANGFAVLSAVQVRLALLGAGITPAMVEAAIESLPEGIQHDTARVYWEFATQFHRDHPFIAAFSTALGLTSEQVDTMWAAAAQIT